MQGMQRQAVETTLTDQPITEHTSVRGTYLLNASLLKKTVVPRVILNFSSNHEAFARNEDEEWPEETCWLISLFAYLFLPQAVIFLTGLVFSKSAFALAKAASALALAKAALAFSDSTQLQRQAGRRRTASKTS
jgi:hypothetical protein